jgi:hypothetical protein
MENLITYQPLFMILYFLYLHLWSITIPDFWKRVKKATKCWNLTPCHHVILYCDVTKCIYEVIDTHCSSQCYVGGNSCKYRYLDMKQICQILWCPLFRVHGIYQVDIIVKIMIVDWCDNINISECMVGRHGYFFCYYPVTVSEQILPHMNIRINLPINEHN